MMEDTGRNADQFPMRFPPGLRDRIKDEAKKNRRSMNAEFVARIEASFDDRRTLRDYFAGQAMQATLGNDTATAEIMASDLEADSRGLAASVARVAYLFADAMLAERSTP